MAYIINEFTGDDYSNIFSGLPEVNSNGERELIDFCNRHKENVLAAMPWVASEIADACGFESLFCLIRHYGGRKIYLPRLTDKFREKYAIAILPKHYDRLCKSAGATGNIDIPSAWGVFVSIRRAAMQTALQKQVPPTLLVQTFGVTMRSIRNLKSKRE